MAKEGKRSITIILDERVHKELKIKVAIEETSIQDFVEDLVKKSLSKKSNNTIIK